MTSDCAGDQVSHGHDGSTSVKAASTIRGHDRPTEAPQWYTADEVHEYLAGQHRIYVSVDIANWIADGFQEAFEKGWALRDGQPAPNPSR